MITHGERVPTDLSEGMRESSRNILDLDLNGGYI